MAVQTAAKTRQDVDSLTPQERLWDSLGYTYGKRGEQIGAEYDRLASQTNNQLLSRGMQRSSYGAQVVANVGKQRADAIAQNQSDLIADYENRLYQIERDQKADEQWQKQYDEQLRQFNENMAFQRERANVSDAQWEKEYAQAKAQFDAQMAENRRQFDLNYNEDVRRYELGRADAAAASGGRGGTTNNNDDGNEENPGDDDGRTATDRFLDSIFGGSNGTGFHESLKGTLANGVRQGPIAVLRNKNLQQNNRN